MPVDSSTTNVNNLKNGSTNMLKWMLLVILLLCFEEHLSSPTHHSFQFIAADLKERRLELFKVGGKLLIKGQNGACLSLQVVNETVCTIDEMSSIPLCFSIQNVGIAEGIFGIFKFKEGAYLCLVEKSCPAPEFGFNGVRKVTSFKFEKLGDEKSLPWKHSDGVDLLSATLSRHSFYFSDGGYDVTRNLQAQHSLPPTSWRSCDDRFFWNLNVVSDFVRSGCGDSWITPFTNAHVQSVPLLTEGSKAFNITLISRRSRFQQGPR